LVPEGLHFHSVAGKKEAMSVFAEDTPVEVRFSEAMMPQKEAVTLFAHLAEASPEEQRSLMKLLNDGPLTLSMDDNARALLAQLGTRGDHEKTLRLVRSYFRLESLRRALEMPEEEFVTFLLGEYDDEANTAGKQPLATEKRELVAGLFRPTAEMNLLYKARRIYDGCLPSFVKSYTTVDFRPVFTDDSKLRIGHGLITTVLEIIVRKPDETAETQRLAVQVDLEDIGQMEDALSRARAKIKQLTQFAKAERGVRLFNPEVSLRGESKE
jgi:hypothetical protein